MLLVTLSFGIIDSRFLWTAWSPDTGGMCFVSQRYGPNDNVTYSTMFLDVNFTFLYWMYYPPTVVGPNGTIITAMDRLYEAYFIVVFKDGTKENFKHYFGGGYPSFTSLFPYGVKTTHSSPTAGIVTNDAWGGWQYTVALLG